MDKKKKVGGRTAKAIAGTLTNVLKTDANSTACWFVYQPKAQKELSRFRRQK